MNQTDILEQTRAYVKAILEGEGSGHDWFHIQRVVNNALNIGKTEKADLFIVELAALLHDIGDHKLHDGDHTVGPRMTREWCEKMQVGDEITNHVVEIVKDLSFKGAKVETPMRTLEGKVVQDGDRLDAIGAIGVGRTFAYGGHKGHVMYDPNIPPVAHDNFEDYKKSTAPVINHFYEKLLLLKDLMNTETAKRLAEDRHAFMEQFLNQFYAEWTGEK